MIFDKIVVCLQHSFKFSIMMKTNNFVFKGLHVVAWIIFVGLCIETGGLIINFIFSLYKPELIQNLYQKLDLMPVFRESKWLFFGMYSYILSISMLKVLLFYILVILMHKIELQKPFNPYVAKQISRISYFTLSIGILGYLAGKSSIHLNHKGFATSHLDQFWSDSQAFILMGAVVYILATIFKKGVDIQIENDLTV